MKRFAAIAGFGLILVLAGCSVADLGDALSVDADPAASASTSAAPQEPDAQSSEAAGTFISSGEPEPCESDMPNVVLDALAEFRGTAETGFVWGKSALEYRGLGSMVRMDCGYTFENPQSGVQIRLTEGGNETYVDYAYYSLGDFTADQGEIVLDGGIRATWATTDEVKFYDETLPFSTTVMSFWIPVEFDRTGNSMSVSIAAVDKAGHTPPAVDDVTRLANALLEDVPGVYEAFYQQFLQDMGYDE